MSGESCTSRKISLREIQLVFPLRVGGSLRDYRLCFLALPRLFLGCLLGLSRLNAHCLHNHFLLHKIITHAVLTIESCYLEKLWRSY